MYVKVMKTCVMMSLIEEYWSSIRVTICIFAVVLNICEKLTMSNFCLWKFSQGNERKNGTYTIQLKMLESIWQFFQNSSCLTTYVYIMKETTIYIHNTHTTHKTKEKGADYNKICESDLPNKTNKIPERIKVSCTNLVRKGIICSKHV